MDLLKGCCCNTPPPKKPAHRHAEPVIHPGAFVTLVPLETMKSAIGTEYWWRMGKYLVPYTTGSHVGKVLRRTRRLAFVEFRHSPPREDGVHTVRLTVPVNCLHISKATAHRPCSSQDTEPFGRSGSGSIAYEAPNHVTTSQDAPLLVVRQEGPADGPTTTTVSVSSAPSR
eukprot:Sspe_Gene.21628::Locus_8120_Transcript_1_1_Confidence_1.000_Length_662::g.21628::m.21628